MAWTKAKQLAALSDTQLTMSFKYDSNGIRTLKRVNGVDTEFTYAGTTLVSQKTGNEIMNFAYTAGGAPYGFTYNGTNYFYLLNLQGDIIGIYDSNGDVVVKYTYDTWGQLMSITGALADTIGVKNPLRYRGYYYDTETKLYYLQSRYYDPETCHFISMDSYFVAGDYINGMNMYAYCLNNPVMYVDPTGQWAKLISSLLGFASTLFSKNYGSTDESGWEIMMMFRHATQSLGYEFIGGSIQSKVHVYSSGVVQVVFTLTDTQLYKNSPKGSYVVEMYYGNNEEWALENSRYGDEKFKSEIFMAVSMLAIGKLSRVLAVLTGIGEYVLLKAEDDYEELLNDMLIESSKNPGTNCYGILHITDCYTDSYIYSY